MRTPSSLLSLARALYLATGLAVLVGCQTPTPVTQPVTPPSARPEAQPSTGLAPVPSTGAESPEVNEEFRGHHRGRAKTRYAVVGGTLAPLEEFDGLEALLAFLRPQIDPIMRYRYPHISEADTDLTQRVAEERHNVSVAAYIHAVKHESGPGGDNDFHVMLGSSSTPGAGIFLTAEASALPSDGPDRGLLANARQELLSIVGSCRCNEHFRQVSPPIHVRVSGSLFFDGVHATGSVGPKYAKPSTVWEIHPILSIERLDAGARKPGPPVATNSGASTDPETQQHPAAP